MRLYKYLSPRRCDVLSDLHVRFTQAIEFNDPFDVTPVMKQVVPLSPVAKDLGRLSPGVLGHLADFLGHDAIPPLKPRVIDMPPELSLTFQLTFAEQFGILSLSEVPTSLLMWSHYADRHQGFVVEFDATNAFFARPTARAGVGRLLKVEYARERPAVIFDPEAHAADPEATRSLLIRQVLLTKSSEWEYEREWRMVLPLTDSKLYPHRVVSRCHLFPLQPEAITAVIIGARATEETKAAIKQALTSSAILRHVQISQARIDDSRFGLCFDVVTRKGSAVEQSPYTRAGNLGSANQAAPADG